MSPHFRSEKARRAALVAELRKGGASWPQVAAQIAREENINARVAMRLAHGYSQSRVAELWSERFPDDPHPVTFKIVSYWEGWPQSGHQPPLERLVRLAELYECDVWDLVDWIERSKAVMPSTTEQPAPLPTAPARETLRLPAPRQQRSVSPRADPDVEVASALSVPPRPMPDLLLPDGSSATVHWLSAEGASRVPSADVDEVLALATDPRASSATVRALHACITEYWRLDDEHGGEALRPAVVGQLRYVLNLLKNSYSDELTRQLYAIAAELARLAGWTYFDAQQFSTARSYFAEAMRLAREIDDRLFMANVLAVMSLQATYEDKPADAASLVQAAQDLVRPYRVPRVLAMLAMREAFALAALGDRAACHQALGDAHRAFERGSQNEAVTPAWVTYFDETKLIVDTGIAHGRLGEHQQAERLIAQALHQEDQRQARPRAFHCFWLATAQLGLGELEQACDTAGNALTISVQVESARTHGHIQDFRRELTPYRGERPVQAFEAQLRAALER